MPSAKGIYVHCDELEKLPERHRENWLREIALLKQTLLQDSTVLQVGCMDGTRILALLKECPDLRITGLDIDAALLQKAKRNFREADEGRHRSWGYHRCENIAIFGVIRLRPLSQ